MFVMVDEALKSIRFGAIELLSRREHSRLELHRKLSVRFEEDTLITKVIEQLTAENLQCDQRFAEAFIRYRFNKGQGPIKIAFDLRQAGVADDSIKQSLEYLSNDWTDKAVQVLEKKFKTVTKEPSIKAKALRFLAQRGFSSETAYNAWDKIEN